MMNYFLVIFRKYLHDYSILKFKVFWLFIISLFKYFMIIKATFGFININLLNSINLMIIFIARIIVIIYLFHL